MENYWKIIGTIIVFLMSIFITQNVNAITLTTEVTPTGRSWENPLVSCMYESGSWVSSTGVETAHWQCNNKPSNWNALIWGIRTNQTYPVEEGKYYQLQLILRNNTRQANIYVNPILWNFSQSSDFDSVTLEEFYVDDKEHYTTCEYSYVSNVMRGSLCSDFSRRYNAIYTFTLRAKTTGNVRFQVGSGTGVLVSGDDTFSNNNVTNYTFGLKKIVEFEGNSQIEQAEEKTEEQSEEGQNNADSADSDNEQATSSLLDIAGNIIGALTSSTTGTCTFDADLGNVDFGELNLCSGKPPEFANIIDIVIMLMLIPLIFMTVVSLVHQFINLTKFAQGGD